MLANPFTGARRNEAITACIELAGGTGGDRDVKSTSQVPYPHVSAKRCVGRGRCVASAIRLDVAE